MTHNILHYKDYILITPVNYNQSTTMNTDKNYFTLKAITNFIYNNGLSYIRRLYSYIENLSNYMVAIKYNKCDYSHILDDDDMKLIYDNL